MTVFQLAGFLSDRGYKVLCVDLDPQGNLTRAFLGQKPDTGMYELLSGEVTFKDIVKQPYPDNNKLKNIYLLPTTYDLFYFKEGTYAPMHLKDELSKYDGAYDFVLIDTNPSISFTTLNALIYANFIFGVLDASLDSIDGFQYLTEEIVEQIREHVSKDLKIIGVLLNENDRRKNITKEILKVMQNVYNKLLFDTYISVSAKAEESRVAKLPIIEYDPRGIATDQYAALTTELIKRLKKEVKFK
jgi:chromosome partitioning protein